MKYLLDTNVLLWYISGDQRLPSAICNIIDDPDNELFVSSASIWEIAIKYSLGHLDLLPDIDTYIETHIFNGGYNILPINALHAKFVSRLPFIHRDPFDRLIFSQSAIEKLHLLYTDSIYNEYMKLQL